jgi:membrane fusion protein (multidrug efflux system)
MAQPQRELEARPVPARPEVVAAPAEQPERASAKPRGSKRYLLLGALLVLVAGVGAFWLSHRGLESTDDAQIDAEVVAVPARTGGFVQEVRFSDNERVKAGQVLALLDDKEAKAKLAQAEASLHAAEAASDAADADARVTETNAKGNKSVAQAALKTASVGATTATDQIKEAEAAVTSAQSVLAQAKLERRRDSELYDKAALSKAQLDQSVTNENLAEASLSAAKARLATLKSTATQARTKIVEANAKLSQTSDVDSIVSQAQARAKSAKAQVDIAKAARDLAKLQLDYTQIIAPADGVVSKKTISVGQAVAPGQTVVELVTQGNWVTANFKETQVARMRVGQAAELDVDAFPGRTFHGKVESFAGATGSRFTLLPPDNATGNFTKVVQRIPVRIKIDDAPTDIVLRPGMSVELTVDTR